MIVGWWVVEMDRVRRDWIGRSEVNRMVVGEGKSKGGEGGCSLLLHPYPFVLLPLPTFFLFFFTFRHTTHPLPSLHPFFHQNSPAIDWSSTFTLVITSLSVGNLWLPYFLIFLFSSSFHPSFPPSSNHILCLTHSPCF